MLALRAAKVDANQPEIVDALRKAGATVDIVALKPYDLVVGVRGRVYLLEIKTKSGKLRDSQKAFRKEWRGHYAIVMSAEQALRECAL